MRSFLLTSVNTKNFLAQCSKLPRRVKIDFNSLIKSYMNIQEFYWSYNILGETFSDSLVIYGNSKNTIDKITFNRIELKKKMRLIYNANTDLELISKVEELKNIKTENELFKKFPLLYVRFLKGKSLLDEYYMNLSNLSKVSISKINKCNEQEKILNRYSISSDVVSFSLKSAKLLEKYLDSLESLLKYIRITNVLPNIISGLDTDKMELYVIAKYFEEYFITDDVNRKELYLSLIIKYFVEEKNNNFVIYNDQNEEITYKKLLYKLNEIIGEQKSKQNTILPINDDVIVSL